MDKIFIVGMPASGKTELGKWLASALNWEHIDLDALIEEYTDNDISILFVKEGEEKFRELEALQLNSLLNRKDIVISTGGGTAAYKFNMDWMNNNGLTIYNATKLSTISSRITENVAIRPMFLGLTKEEIDLKLIKLEKEREIFYSKSKIIYATKISKEKLLNTVNQLLSLYKEMSL